MDFHDTGLLSGFPLAPRRLLTVDDYHRMGEAGILAEDERVELIEGQLIATVPIDCEHAASSNALNRLLVMTVGDRGIVAAGNPVRLNRYNEPQPDFSVLRHRAGYRKTHPRPEDTLLAVEVSNSSLAFDRKVKLALYARNAIPEVWIVNVMAEELEVYRAPAGDSYSSVRRAGRSEILTIEALEGVAIPVEMIFA